MTCIVGLVHNGTVWMGGDSAGIREGGYQRTVTKTSKVFRNGPFLFGITTSFRMGQVLRHAFVPPECPAGMTEERFLATEFVDEVRETMRAAGHAHVDKEREFAGCFLLGWRGRLFAFDDDFGFTERAGGFNAVGSGEAVALGALYAAPTPAPPEMRLRIALEAAAKFNAAVAAPFDIECLQGEAS